jgi:HK97 family phage major capsid protein
VPITELPAPGFGAAITPEEWSRFILDHLVSQSVVLASGAVRVTTSMKEVHVPKITSDGTAQWLDELEEIGETGPEGDELLLRPRKCGELVRLSSEVIADSDSDVLDAAGSAMVRAVALTCDRAFLNGTGGKQPLGVFGQAGQSVEGAVTIDNLITAAGLVSDVGGQARAAFIHPSNFTALQMEKDGNQRPLLTPDFSGGPSSTVYGLALWPTKGVLVDTALVCDPKQIICAIRSDPSVAVSTDAAFTADGAVCRVLARVDVGVNDANGLVSIAAAPAPLSAERSTKK